jgi:uncharacterized repeat protein (TIGR01451 family)
MFRRAVLLLTAMVIGGAAGAGPAWADHSPPLCNANGLSLSIDRDKQTVRNGDVINYGIYIRNDDRPNACDITDATITFAGPGPDGNPSTHPVTVTAQPQSYAGGSGQVFVATVPWTIAVDASKLAPGQTSLTAEAVADGTLHDIDNAVDNAHISKTLGTQAVPSIGLQKVASTTGGLAPQTVTYTYTVTNTSAVVAPISKVGLTDDLCSPLTYLAGDANGDGLLQNSETWTFTCTSLFTNAGCHTNHASVTGTGTVGNTQYPVSAGPVSRTVCVTTPPPPSSPPASPPPASPPQGGVKPAEANHPSTHACVSLASTHLNVRAKELNTVRVRVRLNGRNIAKSKVKITGPAGLKQSGVTNSKGMVTFTVRPRKSGRLTIQSDQCTVKAKVSVKPARRVVAPALPEVTG